MRFPGKRAQRTCHAVEQRSGEWLAITYIRRECYWPEYCDPYASALDDLRSLPYPEAQSGDPPGMPAGALSALVTVMLSEGGESEMVRELKIPLISRKSSDTWSLGAVVLSLMKSLIERMMGGQDSSFGNHQSDGPAPIDSSIRLRRTSEYIYLC